MATISKIGTYTGSGAAQNISVGFIPDYVRIVNITAPAVDEWFTGMTAGTAVSTANSSGTYVAIGIRAAPGGVTAFAGTAAVAGQGFTVGAALSTNASVYRYVALQNGPGAA